MTSWKDRVNALDKLRILKAFVMSLLPLVCCLAACALEGRMITDVYLPAGEWNDELFYFKQVESILRYGFPQGYFGFNESHALTASFAAWSPVLVFPWIIWGFLFGWTLLSPVYCNIFMMMLAVFLFVYLVKPDRKQLLLLGLLFITFTPFTRYMLSGMPEVICFFMVIVLLAEIVSFQKKESYSKLVLLFVMTSVMTLMRPYLIVFMLMPAFFLIRKKRWKGVLIATAVGIVTGIIYVCINHFFAAEYFTPLFDVTWVSKFLNEGIFGGVKYVLWRLLNVGRQFFGLMVQGFRTGLPTGALFGGFILLFGMLLWQAAVDFRKKRQEKLLLHGYLAVCFAGMFAALLLMYKMKEGSKHLATFIAVGIFAVCLMETRYLRKAIAAAAVFAYLYSIVALDPYEYQIPYRTEELVSQVEGWRETFSKELSMKQENVPNYENVIIWPFSDTVAGESEITSYQMLYALPAGFGISCCEGEYVASNLEQLKSRFISAPSGGRIDAACMEQGYREIGRSRELVVYERY